MSEQGFFVPGPLPGMNEMLDARGLGKRTGAKRPNRYNDLKRKWETQICFEIARRRIRPITSRAMLEFFWCEPHRKRDPDNIAAGKKLILDSLVIAGILPNDSQTWIGRLEDVFVEPSSRDPGVLVLIKEMGS